VYANIPSEYNRLACPSTPQQYMHSYPAWGVLSSARASIRPALMRGVIRDNNTNLDHDLLCLLLCFLFNKPLHVVYLKEKPCLFNLTPDCSLSLGTAQPTYLLLYLIV
jgi:hypothetical protein